MSKLGLHVIYGSGLVKSYLEAGTSIVKVVDNVPLARDIASRYPSTVVVERVYHPEQLSDIRRQMGPDAVVAAYAYARRFFLPYRAFKTGTDVRTYVESINEPVLGSVDEARWFFRFSAELARIHRAEGHGSVIGNFATGTPEFNYWEYAEPCARLWESDLHVILGLHEYGHYLHSPGPRDGDYLLHRYRRVRTWLLLQGYTLPRIAITEGGFDEVGGFTEPGYQWWSAPGFTEHEAFIRLSKYDDALMSDPSILGVTLYTDYIPPAGWPNFFLGNKNQFNALVLDKIRSTRHMNVTVPITGPVPLGQLRVKVDLNVRKAPWIDTAPPVVSLVRAGTIIPYFDRSERTGWFMVDTAGDRWVSGNSKFVEVV